MRIKNNQTILKKTNTTFYISGATNDIQFTELQDDADRRISYDNDFE